MVMGFIWVCCILVNVICCFSDVVLCYFCFFFFQAEDGIRDYKVTGVQTCALPISQEGEFMGGGVGEVHGAKLVGLLRRALLERPAAVLLLAESGGVRLHEANAGLIAVSEVMRALLDVRASGIPVVGLIGGGRAGERRV